MVGMDTVASFVWHLLGFRWKLLAWKVEVQAVRLKALLQKGIATEPPSEEARHRGKQTVRLVQK